MSHTQLSQRMADGIVDEDWALIKEPNKTAVLGADTLTEIRRDIEKIEVPSWYPGVPKQPGEVKWGKFKADEWRSFCLVGLPFSLIRLWGTYPKETRHFRMLENYMDLVNAVKLATARSVNDNRLENTSAPCIAILKAFLKSMKQQ